MSDAWIDLAEVARRLGTGEGGGRVNYQTVLAWTTRGLGGVRLATVERDGRPHTSAAELAAFLNATRPLYNWRLY